MYHKNPRAITGDRPTGPLHLGHYVGSLKSRLTLQESHELIVLIADLQGLTDNAGNPQKIRDNIPEVMKDYLAVGLDPNKTTFVLQSAIPELSELTVLLLNLATVSHLERNPTIKSEIAMRGFARDIPAGFLCYPVSQAADMIGLGGGIIPVGDDQLPMIDMANVLIDRINSRTAGRAIERCEVLLSQTARLPGILGDGKMSKSQGSAITLSVSQDALKEAVHKMYTDPNHLKVSDPGEMDGNVVFMYLDAFDPDKVALEALKSHYRAGGLGDMTIKKRLLSVMETEIAPIRERRAQLQGQEDVMMDILREGSQKARALATRNLDIVKDVLGVFRL